jgi:hypothetical protein
MRHCLTSILLKPSIGCVDTPDELFRHWHPDLRALSAGFKVGDIFSPSRSRHHEHSRFGGGFRGPHGKYRIKNDIVSEAVLSLRNQVRVGVILTEDYCSVLGMARARGIMGGLVDDAIHANVARRFDVEHLYTFNISNFEHVAPDLKVRAP